MQAGEKRTFDFSTELYRAVRYAGKNGSATPQLIGFARPPSKRGGFWGKLSGRKGWAQAKVDLRITEGGGFRIREQPVPMVAQRTNGLMTVLFLSCALLTGLTIFFGWPYGPAGCLLAVYLVAVIYRNIILDDLGDIMVIPEQLGGTSFLVRVETAKSGARFHEVEVYYRVIECVHDNRGTDSSTHRHTLHTSPPDQRAGSGNVYRFEHRFADCPPSRNYGDLKIIWNYHLRIKTRSGLEFRYVGVLRVERD